LYCKKSVAIAIALLLIFQHSDWYCDTFHRYCNADCECMWLYFISIQFIGHVAGQLNDQQWTVSTGPTDSLHSGFMSTLRLHRQDPFPTSF